MDTEEEEQLATAEGVEGAWRPLARLRVVAREALAGAKEVGRVDLTQLHQHLEPFMEGAGEAERLPQPHSLRVAYQHMEGVGVEDAQRVFSGPVAQVYSEAPEVPVQLVRRVETEHNLAVEAVPEALRAVAARPAKSV